MADYLTIGSTIKCKNWHDLMKTAFGLSSEGYGVAIIGFENMLEKRLTITAEPDENYVAEVSE